MEVRSSVGGVGKPDAAGSDLLFHRFDTGRLCYTEALHQGRFVGVGYSAMGRPMSCEQVQRELRPRGFAVGAHPWHKRAAWQCAFWLEIDGMLLDSRWRWVSEDTEEKKESKIHRLVLTHKFLPVEVVVVTELDETSLFARHLEIRNLSKSSLRVSRVRSWSGRIFKLEGWDTRHSWQDPAFTVTHYPDFRYGNEGRLVQEFLTPGGRIFSSATGKSGQGYPMVMVTNHRTGETFLCNLEWSGNWQMEAIRENDSSRDEGDEIFFRAGPEGVGPIYLLEPEEQLSTPVCHIGWIYGDLDRCSAELHTHMRRSRIPRPTRIPQYPVEFNNSGYTDNRQIGESTLLDQIDLAHETGVELFVIDAGWFGDREAVWYELVGDWKESTHLDGRFRSVFDRIHSHGMLGGLWVEIERMAEQSQLAKEHPDWWLKRNDAIIGQLDLARPEVVDSLFLTACTLIDRYELDCFRLDYNLRQGEGGERLHEGSEYPFIENTIWRYYIGLYKLFDRLHERYPDLILENCSSGGGRMDLGMMSRFHWTQVSDNWDPVPTLKIIDGILYALPPEQAMTLIGAISPGRADLDFLLRISLFGRMCLSGIYPRIQEIHAQSLERWKRAVEIYREFLRPYLPESVVHHHTAPLQPELPGDWCVLELSAADKSRSMIGIWRLYEPGDHRIVVKPRGISLRLSYTITFDNSGESIQVRGYELAHTGVSVRVSGNLCSELLLIQAENIEPC